MKRLILGLLVLGTLSVAPSVATAQNLLVNGSFEDPSASVVDTPSLALGNTDIPGWTVVNQEIAWIFFGNFGITPSDGLRSLDLAGYHDFDPFGGVTQTIPTQISSVSQN